LGKIKIDAGPARNEPALGWLRLRAEAARVELEQYSNAAKDLAIMMRRIIWQINKLVGDSSLNVLAGRAQELLVKYGLVGDILRDDAGDKQ